MAGSKLPIKYDKRVKAMKALEMRATGVPYYQIQAELGYASPQAVWKACSDMLRRREKDTTDDYRRLQSERLDIALKAIWDRVLLGDDKAIDSFLRIEDRRAKLFGIDVKNEATGGGPGGLQMNILINGVSTTAALPEPPAITVIPTSVDDEEDEMGVVSSD